MRIETAIEKLEEALISPSSIIELRDFKEELELLLVVAKNSNLEVDAEGMFF